MYILYSILAIIGLAVLGGAAVAIFSHFKCHSKIKGETESPSYCEREGVYCIHAPHNDGCERCQGCLVSAIDHSADE